MKRISLLAGAALCLAAALPASAQSNQVEKTKAEIAYEQAETNFAAARDLRKSTSVDCAKGDPSACNVLGDLYRKGLGGMQDYALAAKAYDKSCDAKDGKGCASLAYMTSLGRGSEADQPEAMRLYKASCDYGEVSGCAGYGNMLFTGSGGTKNVAEGTKVLQGACDRQYQWACDRMDALGAYDPQSRARERLKDLRGG